MANGQSYNQYTKCVAPKDYTGLFIGSAGFTGGIIATIILAFLDPGAAAFAAILVGIGYCRWWLYQRLVCLGGNHCFIGLVLRVDSQQDQAGLGKFDTDYTLYLLPAPSPLLGDQDWYNSMNLPANDIQGVLLQDQSLPAGSPANPDFAQMRQRLSLNAPNGFSAETISGYDLVDHDGYQVMSPAQTQALNFLTPPDWQPNYFYTPGDQVRDSNNNLETCTPYSQALSGATAPNWPTPADPTHWQATLGQTVFDGSVQWSYSGPIPQMAILEVEFEGAGVWNLYQALLIAAPFAVAASAVCAIPVLGWIACLILIAIALLITAIGAAVALTDTSAETDVNNQVGMLHPGQDIVFVMGTWIYDGGHIPQGWNELHPVLFCQKIDSVPPDDLTHGQPWQSFPAYSEANLANTINGLCGMATIAVDPGTIKLQDQPENGWTLHPLVDGCTPSPRLA